MTDPAIRDRQEHAVLGAALLSREDAITLVQTLRPQHFHREPARRVFLAMVALHETGTEIDIRTVQAQLELDGAWGTVGGAPFLACLDLDLPDRSDFDRLLGELNHPILCRTDAIALALGIPPKEWGASRANVPIDFVGPIISHHVLAALGVTEEEVFEELHALADDEAALYAETRSVAWRNLRRFLLAVTPLVDALRPEGDDEPLRDDGDQALVAELLSSWESIRPLREVMSR